MADPKILNISTTSLQVSWIRLRDWHILSAGLNTFTKVGERRQGALTKVGERRQGAFTKPGERRTGRFNKGSERRQGAFAVY